MEKEGLQKAVVLLDDLIDHTPLFEVMMAVQQLRRMFLESGVETETAEEMFMYVRELHGMDRKTSIFSEYLLPICRIVFLLCAPGKEFPGDVKEKCVNSIEKIRWMRRWKKWIETWNPAQDDAMKTEILSLFDERLSLLQACFFRELSAYRQQLFCEQVQHRKAYLDWLESEREKLPKNEVQRAAGENRVNAQILEEKILYENV